MSLAALRQRLAALVPPPPVAGSSLPTGLAALDAALSDGGLPCGRLTEIVGGRGSGKTTLVREIVARTLADKRWVAYIDAGRTLAPADWAALARTGRLWIVRPPAAPRPRGTTTPRETAAPPPRHPPDRSVATNDGVPVAHGPWCADVLLRSGAFGLVVLDGAPALPRAVAVRLTRLARESHAAFVIVRETGGALDTARGTGRPDPRAGRGDDPVGGAVRLRVRRRPRPRPDGEGGARATPVPSGRTTLVLEVSVEKGGTHHVVEVGCAIEVARRLCTHPQVPDRRGVAARNRRGERVAPDAPGVRRTAPAPDGGTGGGPAERVGATLQHKRRCAEPAVGRDTFLLGPPGQRRDPAHA